MMMVTCWAALAVAGVALGAPLDRRDEVDHDSLIPIPTRVQAGVNGGAILRFNPRLHTASGCQPYTAVDDAGNTSGGLQDSGSSTGGCGDTTKAQTYARVGTHNNMTAIMYSWYMPKDQLIDGISAGAHRHDWENVVVWIDDPAATNPTVLGGATSGHGGYEKVLGALPGGDSAQVEYYAEFPYNHQVQFTETVGLTHEVSDWDAMPDAAKSALQWTDFGSALVPFKDGGFEWNLGKAEI